MVALRIGVIVDDWELPAWQYRALDDLAHDGAGELALLIVLSRAPPPRVRGLAFRGYEWLDQRLFGSESDPGARVGALPLLEPLPRREAEAVRRLEGFDLAPDDLRFVREQHLDAVLQLGGGRLAGGVLDCARLGVWTFSHDDEWRLGVAPLVPGDSLVTESRLVARTGANERVLYRSFASANFNSLARNRGATLWKSAAFPSRAARAFAEGREPPFDGGPTLESERAVARTPGALEIARRVATVTARVVRNRWRLRREDRIWFVALRRRRQEPLVDDPLDGFEPLPCPPDRFHADPMLVLDDRGAHHLFFEDADRASGIGVIAWRAIESDGRAGPSRVVLEADHHLSYPYVFRWRDDYYMIPETVEKRTIELHRAVEFPLHWRLEKVLFHDVVAADTTVLEHAGRLWLFTAMSTGGAALNDELFLFHSATPSGEWVPHPWNPIVSDVRRARPAGPLFHDAGRLWRPGQDCAGDYGAALWLSRVDVLDEHRYRETPMRRIDPGWTPGGLCTHTYASAGAFEVLDGRVWQPRDRFPSQR